MDIKVQRGSIEATQADVIIVNLFEGVAVPAGATGAVDKALNGAITDVIRSGDYRGKLNELSVLYPRGAVPAKRVIVVGLGKVADFNLDRVRQAAAWSARKARDLGCKSIATVAHGAGTGQIDPEENNRIQGGFVSPYRTQTVNNLPVKIDGEMPVVYLGWSLEYEMYFYLTVALLMMAVRAGAADGGFDCHS